MKKDNDYDNSHTPYFFNKKKVRFSSEEIPLGLQLKIKNPDPPDLTKAYTSYRTSSPGVDGGDYIIMDIDP